MSTRKDQWTVIDELHGMAGIHAGIHSGIRFGKWDILASDGGGLVHRKVCSGNPGRIMGEQEAV